MRLRELFTVPGDKKISDKAFSRALFASICSILLCIGCLVGTTWAWFIVSVENEGNVIEIATISTAATVYAGDVEVTPDPDGSYTLPVGTYTLQVQVANTATDSVRPIYVLMTVTQNDQQQQFYLAFDGVTDTTITVTVEADPATLFLSARWAQPVATQVVDAVTFTQVTGDSTTSTIPDDVTTTETVDTTTTTVDGETTTSTTEDVTTTTDTVETTTTTEEVTTTTETESTETTTTVAE